MIPQKNRTVVHSTLYFIPQVTYHNNHFCQVQMLMTQKQKKLNTVASSPYPVLRPEHRQSL